MAPARAGQYGAVRGGVSGHVGEGKGPVMRAAVLLGLLASGLSGVIAWQVQHLRAGSPAVPVRPPAPDAPAATPAALAVRPAAQWAGTVLARPLFNPARRPPAASAAAPVAAAALPRLTGILISPTGRTAIFASGERPVAVVEGGVVAGYLVRSIQPGRVVLAGPGGEHSVRPSYDANRPPPPAPLRLAPAAPPGPSLGLPDAAKDAMPFDQNPAPTGADILRNFGRTAEPPRR